MKYRKCLKCKKKTKNKKFCSHLCANIYMCKGKISRNRKNFKIKYCLNCDSLIQNNCFCSVKCQGQYRRKKRNKLIKAGEKVPIGSFRSFFLEEYKQKCMQCGWGKMNKYTGKVPLDLHHKDGNHKNNSLLNLILLCPNCHSLAENYKNNNRHGTRIFRRKYQARIS